MVELAPQKNPAPTAPKKEKGTVFDKPEQIGKILQEMVRLRIPVLLKHAVDGKAVRGMVDHYDDQFQRISISGISPAGDQILMGHEAIRIEFVLMSTKLVFASQVCARSTGRVLINKPLRLVSIERRGNSRFPVPAHAAAFIEFPQLMGDPRRLDSRPGPMSQDGVMPLRLRIDDVSLGGLACFTRFLSATELLVPGQITTTARISFPHMATIELPVLVRWSKKSTVSVQATQFDRLTHSLKQRVKLTLTHDAQFKTTFQRFGIQFPETSKEFEVLLRTFIRSVQQANAV